MQVSVVIPAYNSRLWVLETLGSVQGELNDGIEVIVVDDGSTDDTAKTIEQNFPFVKLICQKNQGVSAARAAGLSQATGTYVKYLDADDLLASGSVRRQVRLAEDTGADVVYGNWSKLGQDSANQWRVFETINRRIEDVHRDPEIAFFTSMWCTTGAYLWRRSFLVQKHPGWSPRLPVIQDARYALDAAMHGATFVHDNEVAATYRCHKSNSVSTKSRYAFNYDCLVNSREVYELWKSRDVLGQDRRSALLDVCEEFGFGSYEVSPKLSAQFFELAYEIDSSWYPHHTLVRKCFGRIASPQNLARARNLAVAVRRQIRNKLRYLFVNKSVPNNLLS